MAQKRNQPGVPKRDGSGKGARANKGRGGCTPPCSKRHITQVQHK